MINKDKIIYIPIRNQSDIDCFKTLKPYILKSGVLESYFESFIETLQAKFIIGDFTIVHLNDWSYGSGLLWNNYKLNRYNRYKDFTFHHLNEKDNLDDIINTLVNRKTLNVVNGIKNEIGL